MVSLFAIWYARRSALATERQAIAEEDNGRLQREEFHDRCQPLASGVLTARSSRLGGYSVFYTFALPRSYRTKATAINEAGMTELSSYLPLRAGDKADLHVDQVAEGGTPKWKTLHLEFWPPNSSDPVPAWTCPCGRPVLDNEAAHWELRVPVEIDPPREPFAFYA